MSPDPSHVIETLYGKEVYCVRCMMCTCHCIHKLDVECQNVDGRVKRSTDD